MRHNVGLDSQVGYTCSQGEGIGLHIQLVAPGKFLCGGWFFFLLRPDFHRSEDRIFTGGHNHAGLFGLHLLLVRDEYGRSVTHPVEIVVQQQGPGFPLIQLLQEFDTPVDELVAAVVIHQRRVGVQYGKDFQPVAEIGFGYLFPQRMPGDVAVVAGDDAVGDFYISAHKMFEGGQTLVGQTAVELVTAFGGGGTAECHFRNLYGTVMTKILDESPDLFQVNSIVPIVGVYISPVHTEVNRYFRA